MARGPKTGAITASPPRGVLTAHCTVHKGDNVPRSGQFRHLRLATEESLRFGIPAHPVPYPTRTFRASDRAIATASSRTPPL